MPRSVTNEDIGLNVVYTPESDGEHEGIELEIVAVHGLGAHPSDTWTTTRDENGTKRRINWLCEKDMLPNATPKARIWQFGYHSQWFGRESLGTTATNIAKILLAEIKDRKLVTDRPIIFISHSFGGLVVLKALSLSFYQYCLCEGLFQKVGGLIFFGTPFRGARGLGIDDMIMAALSVYEPQDIEPQALEIMQAGSETLLELIDQFCSIWSLEGTKPIACFYELQPSEVGKVVGGERRRAIVVDENAGCLDLFPGISKQPLQRNHFNINKFSLPWEMGFRHTREEIVRIAEIAVQTSQKTSNSDQNVTKKSFDSALISAASVNDSDPSRIGLMHSPENQPSSSTDPTRNIKESNQRDISVVCHELLTTHQMSLGRLVRDIEEPEGDFFVPGREVPADSVGVNSYGNYEDVQPSVVDSLPTTLSRLCSESITKRSATTMTRVTADHITTHRLRNPRSWFALVIQDRSTREWIEQSARREDDIYLVVGFYIMKDAAITEYNMEQQKKTKTLQMRDDLGKESIQRRFVKTGNHVCAIKYQQIRCRWHSSHELDTAWLVKENFWKNYWTLRGDETDVDDVVEAYLQDRNERLAGYELYTKGNESFQYRGQPRSDLS